MSTHIAGPRLHSQFRYAIRPVGVGASELEFRGRELRWDRPYDARERRALARALRREDAALWRRFARALEADRAPRRRGDPDR